MRRQIALSSLSLLLASVTACESESVEAKEPVGRFAAVSKSQSSKASEAAQRKLCDVSYPASGNDRKPLPSPPLKAIPGHDKPKVMPRDGGWRWLNLWATWCGPCVEELPLIDRWKGALAKDGVKLDVELLSVDEDEGALTDWLAKKAMPGAVTWLRSQDDLGPTLESFGLERTSAIPIHIFVDESEAIRCIRVGALHEPDYGAVKAILKGS